MNYISKNKKNSYRTLIVSALLIVNSISCKKIVDVENPIDRIVPEQVFSDSTQASSAINGLYSKISFNYLGAFAQGRTTILLGQSADELSGFFASELYQNLLSGASAMPSDEFWAQIYSVIYVANACIEGISKSSGMSDVAKGQLISEAKFIRAFCYFYLINLYGDVPYITSIEWEQTRMVPRTSFNEIYLKIVEDLKEAQLKLKTDYSISGNERVHVNKDVATALLARVYLYTKKWSEAESESSKIINNTAVFGLNQVLNNVFLKNNKEAILQWRTNGTATPFFNVTGEGYKLVPYSGVFDNFLQNSLLNSFEANDQRKVAWITTVIDGGIPYAIPYKYKLGYSQVVVNGPTTEYYTIFRVAEQILIRAEARAEQNNLIGAIDDINQIRRRAGLPDLSNTLNKSQVLVAVEQERRIELFAEWGHRWLDLKRTGRVDAVMTVMTPIKNGGRIWSSHQQLYPIPFGEMRLNPFLVQNTGY